LVFVVIGTSLFAYYHHPNNHAMLQEVRVQVASRDKDLKQERVELEELKGPLDGRRSEAYQEREAAYRAKLAEKAAMLTPKQIGDKVLPHFIVNELWPGMAGLLIAAIFAAAMSSIDTSLNSSATVMLSDLYLRYLRKQAGERESMRVLYGMTLLMGILGTGTAVAMIGVESVLEAWWKLSGIFAGAMLGLFLLGLLARRAGRTAAVIAVTFGVVLIAWMTFTPAPLDPDAEPMVSWWPETLRSPLSERLIPVFGSTGIVLAGFLAGLVFPRRRSPQ
jgi:SSS family solute:Na+ symporter